MIKKQKKSNRRIGGKHIKPIGGYMVYIKPLSVNQAWQGRRRKSIKYRDYEKELLLKLRNVMNQSGRFPVKTKAGANYHEMKDMSSRIS